MTTSTLALLVALLYSLSLCICFGSSMTSASVIVNTTYGPVNGSVISLKRNKTVITYLGIPFAKAGRFEDPVPPNKWSSILQADKIDKICPQPALPPNKVPLMSEDCLLLNVYVPGNATSGSALAVMLWIHGGGYIIGDTIFYDGSVLATEGNVIVVTAAYRLGVFGFLSANSDNLRGNYGMMDQIAAMKWVNKNIASFGGDPNKVTIFGESAGGFSVALLLLSPLASGLYQNVIIESGTAVSLAALLERDEAELRARSFAKAVGCDITSLKMCAKKKSFQDLLAVLHKVDNVVNFLPFAPVVDGFFMPGLLPVLDLSKGISRALFIEAINNRTWVRNQNSQILELLIYEYTDWSNSSDPILLRQQFIDINTDANFKAPAIQSAKAFVKKQAYTYFYQLEIAPKRFGFIGVELLEPAWAGIYHGADIFYVFGFPLLMDRNLSTAEEIKVAKDIMTMWTNFAKTGNPNLPTPLGLTWPQYTADQGEYLGLRPNMTVRSKMLPDKMTLWNEFLPSIEETVRPTTANHMPTTSSKPEDKKDKLVLVLGILTGLFGALAVILLVVLIVTCCKRKRRGKDYEEPLNM
ncbi:cocaine esterase-like isoform X2 [Oculina patagonica]